MLAVTLEFKRLHDKV